MAPYPRLNLWTRSPSFYCLVWYQDRSMRGRPVHSSSASVFTFSIISFLFHFLPNCVSFSASRPLLQAHTFQLFPFPLFVKQSADYTWCSLLVVQPDYLEKKMIFTLLCSITAGSHFYGFNFNEINELQPKGSNMLGLQVDHMNCVPPFRSEWNAFPASSLS